MMEFFFFVRLAHKGFYHAHALDIFLNRIVQSVVLTEYPFKQRAYLMDHGKQSDPQNRDDHQEDQRHLSAHNKRHRKGKDQHQWAADRKSDQHHKCQLDVHNVRRHSRH